MGFVVKGRYTPGTTGCARHDRENRIERAFVHIVVRSEVLVAVVLTPTVVASTFLAFNAFEFLPVDWVCNAGDSSGMDWEFFPILEAGISWVMRTWSGGIALC